MAKCNNCGTECKQNANFCKNCGTKIKKECDCWIKKGIYNCGESKCPGYGLYMLEKSRS